jgi:hypothetical protein
MSFDLAPQGYLEMLNQEHEDYRKDPLSLRRAISCSTFANHLSEFVFAQYKDSDPAKLDGCVDEHAYRNHLVTACPDLGLIRDICEFGKHGPVLGRSTVRVAQTGVEKKLELDTASFMMGFPNHVERDRLVIKLKDGSECYFDVCLANVVNFWNGLFQTKNL